MMEKAKDKGVKLLLPADTRLPPTEFAPDAKSQRGPAPGPSPTAWRAWTSAPTRVQLFCEAVQGRGHRRLERPDGRL